MKFGEWLTDKYVKYCDMYITNGKVNNILPFLGALFGVSSYEQFKKGDSAGSACSALFSAASFGFYCLNQAMVPGEKRKILNSEKQ